jgi:hypothetical protein
MSIDWLEQLHLMLTCKDNDVSELIMMLSYRPVSSEIITFPENHPQQQQKQSI